jgi:two-component system, OmpR family, phosphate regulon response regulator PhoB
MPPSILLIEDDPDVRDLLVTKLGRAGYQVTATHRGDDGLRLARQLGPTLVLLDWVLPGASGLEVARRLRAGAATAAIPVVMVSAHAGQEHQRQARAAGILHYVVKPFGVTALLRLVACLVDQPSATPAVSRPAGTLHADGLAWLSQQAQAPPQPGVARASGER